MFFLTALALLFCATSATASAIPNVTPPQGYAEGYLEPYNTYHIRYLAIPCPQWKKNNRTAFNDCCHPMLATENLKDSRKPYCTPSPEAYASASAALPTSTVLPDFKPPPASPAPTPAPPAANVALAPMPSPPPPPAQPAPPSPPPNNGGPFGNIIGNIFQGGIATFYEQKGIPGACRIVHRDDEYIVALQTQTYANGAHCGKKVRLRNANTGMSVDATVADECPTCNNPQSVDLSSGLFERFAPLTQGTFKLEWAFVPDGP